MNSNRTTLAAIAVALLAVNAGAAGAPNIANLIYSVDIGSDWEVSDPNPNPPDSPDVMDPGDMYMTPPNPLILPPDNMAKNDLLIWGTPEAWPIENNPATAVPVPTPFFPGGNQEDSFNFFDMDGEDQLDTDFEIIIEDQLGIPGPGNPINGPITASPGGGLLLNPDRLIFSYDDDQAPAWWSVNFSGYGDVPVTTFPDYGLMTNEVLYAEKWRVWPADLPCATETDLGLGPDPHDWQQEAGRNRDDDVDALDNELWRYWYWTADHEAHKGLDPADIYITDRSYPSGNFTLAIDNKVIGVADGTDIDAFEFCLTSDDDIIQYFNNDGLLIVQLDTNKTYLAVVFSVDQDDPTTSADESGTLLPNGIYISLLTGNIPGSPAPFLMNQRAGANGVVFDEDGEDDDDVDAITFEEEPEPTEDWGDAPDSVQSPLYPTLSANNGARHTMVPGIYLGSKLDGEFDGQPTNSADGDDIDSGGDDEDGVTFTSRLYQNYMASVTVVASTGGYLNAWVDFGANFTWSDPGDQIFINLPMHKGANHLVFPVSPSGLPAPYQTYARFRFTQNQLLPAVDYGPAADGEVEDYKVRIEDEEGLEYDFGDADFVYPVLDAGNGAKHAHQSGDTLLTLGLMWDSEPDGQPSPDAMMDDITGGDEDGVFFPAPLYRGSNVTIVVAASAKGFLGGWIDFNNDGDWDDAGEQVYGGSVTAGFNPINISVPSGAEFGRTFGRFRISTLSSVTPYGFAPNGEVEDYELRITQPAPSGGAFSITNISMVASNKVEVKWEYESGLWYELQSSTQVQSNLAWILVDFVAAGSCVDTNAVETSKFYRVVVPYTP